MKTTTTTMNQDLTILEIFTWHDCQDSPCVELFKVVHRNWRHVNGIDISNVAYLWPFNYWKTISYRNICTVRVQMNTLKSVNLA